MNLLAANPQPTAEQILRYVVYDTFAQVRPWRQAWDDLAEQAGDLMSSYDWCRTWWRYFGANRRLEIHTLHAGERLVAVLPLFRETLRVWGARLRVVRLVGCDYTIDAAGVAIDPEVADIFFERVLDTLEARGRWDVLQLGPLRSYAAVSEQIAQTAASHASVQAVILGRCDDWETHMPLPQTYELYLQGLAGVDRRETLRRERKLRDGREVRIGPVYEPLQVQRGMDALIQLHQQLWTGRGQPGHFGEHLAVTRFHRSMARRMARTRQLALIPLQVDGQVLGVTYGFMFGTRMHSIFRGYCHDELWRRFGLGRQLHCRTVQLAIEQGATSIDDGLGAFEYKMRLGDRLHGQRSVLLLRRGWRSRLRFWLALRTAYLVHGVYARIWRDALAQRLGLRHTPWHCYSRIAFLAKLYRRTRFRLFGQAILQEAQRATPPLIALAFE